jgi:ankyrin repeat protein
MSCIVSTSHSITQLVEKLKKELVDFLTEIGDFTSDMMISDTMLCMYECSCNDYPNIDIIRYFIEQRGVDVNSTNSDGETMLMLLCLNDYSEQIFDIIRYLVERRDADIFCRDKWGRDCFMCICKCCSTDTRIIKYFLDHGSNIHSRDLDGWTTLAYCCNTSCDDRNLTVIKYLIECCGADPKSHDNDGRHPIDLAYVVCADRLSSGCIETLLYMIYWTL